MVSWKNKAKKSCGHEESLTGKKPVLTDIAGLTIQNGQVATLQSHNRASSIMSLVANFKDELRDILANHGAVLLRGFRVESSNVLPLVVCSFGESPFDNQEETSPRTYLGQGVFTSTEYPNEYAIEFHNECSYQNHVPQFIFMLCIQAAPYGGCTRLSSCADILQQFPDALLNRFRQSGYIYERNYLPHTGLSWQQSLSVTSLNELKRYCNQENIELQVTDDSHVRTRQKRPCVARHPDTGKALWLNHTLFFHHLSIPNEYRQSMGTLTQMRFPFDTRYGDGQAIDVPTMELIKDLYEQNAISVQWQPGDVLIFDNLSMAHAREPFEGERELYLAMAKPIAWKDMDINQDRKVNVCT
ncbi:taurine catabolism dioxygenase TauD [Photorhabdus khanii]|uniref:Taurine catabolism dioxygenase TauD n=1 Tax=Photorhabdus khanii TaxID=1004150 RepID=A0A7C9GH10_9GAMM|nr:TauD/TfdA family dioxygenase [Photorhabdus khanii]MQL46718.1 taurine catabolism dioxygenase TauD [Photorhabdus khanii]